MANAVQAQDTGNITGTVTDASSGETLPGVNIVIEGTQQGAATDAEGHYRISDIEAGTYTLLASFVGYEDAVQDSVEVFDGETTVVNFALQPGLAGLDEVVVVGYGTQERRDLTGAISSVSSEEIQRMPAISLEQALQGRAAGVQVRQTGGDLGGDFSVFIRGIASTGATQPLYVVDGVPLFSEALQTIDPDDIASIEMLKDASATAIYGARASNGVVIITTKSGNAGEGTRISVEAETSLEWASKTLNVVNSTQMKEITEDAFINDEFAVPDNLEPAARNYDNEWQELILRTGLQQDYDLSVAGGDESTQFFVSGNYQKHRGILIDTDLQKVSLRVNLDHQASSTFSVGARLTGSTEWGEGSRNDQFYRAPFRGAVLMRPWIPNKDEDGNYIQIPPRTGAYANFVFNPIAKIETDIRNRSFKRFLGSVYAEYEVVGGLQLRTNLGADILFRDNYTYLPILEIGGLYNRSTGRVTESRRNEINWVIDQTLTYTTTFGERHNFEGLIGFTAQKFMQDYVTAVAEGTLNNDLRQLTNQPDLVSATDLNAEAGLTSYFARINYDYDNKYLLTATVRRDGSSRFGSGNRFGTFPSVSVGWRLSEEAFMQEVGFLEDLKFRASYGLTGNQSIGNFRFLALAAPTLYAWGNEVALANQPVSFNNPELKWETSRQFDVGLDATLFGGRLSLTADFYNKVSDDLLVSIPVPPANGITSSQTVNLGEVLNRGVEFALHSINVIGEDYIWTTDFNVATNRNEVVDIGMTATGESRTIFGQRLPSPFRVPVNITKAGYPIGALYGYIWEGIWQLEEAEEAARYGVEPGDAKFRDLNNDGIIDVQDRLILGQPWPSWYGGLANTFEYKDFTLSALLSWQIGHKLVNTLRMQTTAGAHGTRSTVEYYKNYWREDRPSNTFPKPHRTSDKWDNTMPSTKYIGDASFLRLQNVSLTYTLPQNVAGGIGLSSASLSLIGTNLLTITGYSGLSPSASSRESSISAGQDQTPYPLPKSVTLRLSLAF